MNNETLDINMFSDLEKEESFNVEDIRYEEPELYQAITGGVL